MLSVPPIHRERDYWRSNMLPFIEHLQEATIVKKFLDELQKNPSRTLFALAAVLLLTGAGVMAAYRTTTGTRPPLSQLPTEPARQGPGGKYDALPQAKEAERELAATLNAERQRHEAILQELGSRKDNAPVTEREVRLVNESGVVTH